jgi:hypothetical protein
MSLQVKESESGQVVRAGIDIGGGSINPGVLHVAAAVPKISDRPVAAQMPARRRSSLHAEGTKDLLVQEIII